MKDLLRIALLALFLCAAPIVRAQQTTGGGILFASAAHTESALASQPVPNQSYRGVHVIVTVSAYTSGNYTPQIQAFDPASQAYYPVLTGPAISATGTTVLKIYPGNAAIANGSAADLLPQLWRVVLTGAATPSMTLSVGYNWVQ